MKTNRKSTPTVDDANMLDDETQDEPTVAEEAAYLAVWERYAVLSGLLYAGMAKSNWIWDDVVQRYRYTNVSGGVGRLVPIRYVKNDISRIGKGVRAELRTLTRRLVSGEITQEVWESSMRKTMRITYRSAFVAANGGRAMMTQRLWGIFGAQIKKEYGWLSGFVRDLNSGKQGLNGFAINRAGMYGDSTRRFYEQAKSRAMTDAGFTKAKRVLSAAEHCQPSKGLPGCVELSALGFVPIQDLVPIGSATCRSGCQCTVEYGK